MPLLRSTLTLGVIALCFSTAVHAQELAANQVLRRGNGTEPATLDPQKSEAVPDANIEFDLFDGLTTYDHDHKLVGGAAEGWAVSPDGVVYTFTLRPGLKWSNGQPLTAEDFVYSFRRLVDPATGSKYSFLAYPILNAEEIATGKITDVTQLGIAAPDPQTVKVTLKSATGIFPSVIAHHAFLPVDRKSVEQFGAQFARPGNLVSNGAFTLKEWTPQSRLVLVKNPNYWAADKVKLTEVDYYPIENQNEELKRYRADEIDITNEVPSDQLPFIRQNLDKEFHVEPYLGVYYYGFNLEQPPFKDNLKLRQALSMAIDREVLVDKVVGAGEKPAYGWVPPGIAGYHSQSVSWATLSQADRLAQAKKLYGEAGYGPDKPLKVELRYNTSENHKKIAIAVAAMLKQNLGVNVSLVNEEFKTFLETRKLKKVTQMFRAGWIGDYADPNTFAELLQSDAGLNDFGYASAAYDKLVKQAAVTVDSEKRADLLEQAERVLLDDLPMMPIYFYVQKRLVKPTVIGYSPNVLGFYFSRDMAITR